MASVGPLAGTDCQAGPSVGTYLIDGREAGMVACHPDPRNLRSLVIAWTDRLLLTLAFGTVATDDHGALWDWWLGAGPVR